MIDKTSAVCHHRPGLSATGVISAGAQQRAWQFTAYDTAMQESGRQVGSADEQAFLAAQERKQKYIDEIKAMLERNFGAADPAILKAFEEVPREYFMYNYEAGRNMGQSAYEIPAQEWKIGYGSVLTDYIDAGLHDGHGPGRSPPTCRWRWEREAASRAPSSRGS